VAFTTSRSIRERNVCTWARYEWCFY